MYKLLLCWRYLKTRYLALACIIGVMLGVATLIVVNSVMGGFSTKLRERLHGLLADVVIEAYDFNGFAGYQAGLRDPGTNRIVWRRDRIAALAGDRMPTVALSIPAGVLRSQHYSLELNGTNASGEAEVAGSYVFQVVRR